MNPRFSVGVGGLDKCLMKGRPLPSAIIETNIIFLVLAPDMRSGRKRRAASTLIRCTLALVADFLFFEEMGGRDKRQSINYMVRQLA